MSFIPEGDYCYKIIYIDRNPPNTGFRIVINHCDYYQDTSKSYHKTGFCNFMNDDVDDQCKICGVNIPDVEQ